MKPTKVLIGGYITVGNEQWVISVEAEVEATEYKALIAETAETILKLKKAGFRSPQDDPPGAKRPDTRNRPNEKPGAAFAWPAPVCPVCNVDMKVSKFQANERKIYFYCPRQVDMGLYCKQGASVDNSTGSTEYWEVKK